MAAGPRVSFIVPCYDEVANVGLFAEEMAATFGDAEVSLELVFVDDGSTDGTFDAIVAAAQAIPEVVVRAIQFSRNFGKEAAIWAGLHNATGDLVGIIDADLQQPPADALAMVRLLLADPDVDCVAAYQEQRYERGPAAWFHRTFYKVLSALSGMDVLADASDFRVFRRIVAEAICSMPENFRFSKGIFAWVGFNTLPYPYQVRDRNAGSSKFSFLKLVRLAMDGILGFSIRPLQLATVLGFVMSLLAIIYLIIIFVRALIVGIETPGYVTTIGVVLLIGGIQLLMLGIIGEYLARDYMEGKRRPLYIERRRFEAAGPDGAPGKPSASASGAPSVPGSPKKPSVPGAPDTPATPCGEAGGRDGVSDRVSGE